MGMINTGSKMIYYCIYYDKGCKRSDSSWERIYLHEKKCKFRKKRDTK